MLQQAELSESGRRTLAAVVLGLFAAYSVIYLSITGERFAVDPIGDFFGLWSCGRFIAEHPAVEVYDPAALHAAQVAMGMRPAAGYPFPYPPTFLLALWPLGQLSYWTAFAVAIGGSLLLYLWATVGRHWRSVLLPAAVFAPTTTLAIVAGQGGFLSAALLAGGFRLAAQRPILGGILLGLLTYKPQLGVLVPVALLAAGLWRTIAAAAATFALLVVATSLAFGGAIWAAWIDNVVGYSQQFAAESSEIVHLMPSVVEALKVLGASPELAWIGQGVAAGFAATIVWRCFRWGPRPIAAAVLFAATFLATPHAFVYDMPVVATAVLWVIADERLGGPAFAPVEIGILLLTLTAPITMPAGTARFPIVALALILFVGMTARRCRQSLPMPQSPVPSGRLSSSAAESP
jgi:alpha-1,2-mannosyltransferase